MRLAILGAGLASIAAARRLAAAGLAPVLFDKGRAAGGRLATRRAGGFAFDHGAQYLTAADPAFAALLREAGAQPWPASGGLVGVPGMSALPRALAAGLDLRAGRQVTALERTDAGWRLAHTDARAGGAPETQGPFDALLCTFPAPQAAALLAGAAPGLAARAAAVPFLSCWTLMAAFPSRLPLPDALTAPSDAIVWAARDSAKPGRDAAAECWVVQAGPAWTAATLELPAEATRGLLLAELARLAGPLPDPLHAEAHRWRFAAAAAPLGAACLWDASLRLGLAGDWCLGERAHSAWASGTAAAEALLESLAHA
jgi:predicted NAD/FAD-dependent oxidoreductase